MSCDKLGAFESITFCETPAGGGALCDIIVIGLGCISFGRDKHPNYDGSARKSKLQLSEKRQIFCLPVKNCPHSRISQVTGSKTSDKRTDSQTARGVSLSFGATVSAVVDSTWCEMPFVSITRRFIVSR